MLTAQAFATCLLMAANTYQVPPAVMIGIMQVEGGHVGQQAGPNLNGTYDLGPMQVNTRWVPKLADLWHVNTHTARHVWVRDDGCVNVHVAAWILKQKIAETGNLYSGIAYYHSATRGIGYTYANKVVAVMERKGLIKHDERFESPRPSIFVTRNADNQSRRKTIMNRVTQRIIGAAALVVFAFSPAFAAQPDYSTNPILAFPNCS